MSIKCSLEETENAGEILLKWIMPRCDDVREKKYIKGQKANITELNFAMRNRLGDALIVLSLGIDNIEKESISLADKNIAVYKLVRSLIAKYDEVFGGDLVTFIKMHYTEK
jgi:hypothetical protein